MKIKIPWRLALGIAAAYAVSVSLLGTQIGTRNARLWLLPISGVAIAYFAARQWKRGDLQEQWAATRGLSSSPSVSPEIQRYLNRQRVFTVIGGGLGAALPSGIHLATAPQSPDYAFLLFLLVPLFTVILAAQMLAELTFRPEAGGTVRRAELARRALTDFVPRGLVALLRFLGALSVLLGIGTLLFEFLGDESFVVVTGVTTGAFVIAVEFAQRWRTRWPRPFESTESAHVQDVLRADSIRSAIWSGVLGSCGALTAQLSIIGRELDQPAGWTLPLLGWVALITLMVTGFRSGLRGFTLSRSAR